MLDRNKRGLWGRYQVLDLYAALEVEPSTNLVPEPVDTRQQDVTLLFGKQALVPGAQRVA